MSYFAVIREAGPGWDTARAVTEQPGVAEHAAFMNALAADGFLIFAGPLAGSGQEPVRILLVFDAGSRAEIEQRLADDPWIPARQLLTRSIDPWTLFVGAERLAG